MKQIGIKNAKLINEDAEGFMYQIIINNGIITDITTNDIPKGYATIDADFNYVVPGFIDLQVYGAAGKLFSAYPTVDTLQIIENELLKQGTTGFLICVATTTTENMKQAINAVKAYQNSAKNCLGIHLEGPYLNSANKGAHIESCIKKASLAEVKDLVAFGEGVIKMITIAPELQDEEVIQYLLAQDIIVSIGHSSATFEQATNAYNMGVQTTTHLFNAMSPIHHRLPGIPTAVYNHKKAMASIIADGYHVDYEVIKVSYQLMKDRLFLITDAVTTCEVGPYQHQLQGDKYVMPNGTLSGSALTMLQAVKNCVSHCNIPMAAAIEMATSTPAKLLRQNQHFGSVKIGHKANLNMISPSLQLVQHVNFL